MNPQWWRGGVSAGQAAFADTAIFYHPIPNKVAPSCTKPLVGHQVWDVDNGWSSVCTAPGKPIQSACGVKNSLAESESLALAFLNGGEGRY